MKSNLRILLEEFLDDSIIVTIETRAKELDLTVKVRKIKGRWHRETLKKLIKDRDDKCQLCGIQGEEVKLTLDHIIPKKMLLDMGLDEYYDDEANLDVVCAKCNARKGSQLDFSNPKTIALLEKYMDLYQSRRGLKLSYGDKRNDHRKDESN